MPIKTKSGWFDIAPKRKSGYFKEPKDLPVKTQPDWINGLMGSPVDQQVHPSNANRAGLKNPKTQSSKPKRVSWAIDGFNGQQKLRLVNYKDARIYPSKPNPVGLKDEWIHPSNEKLAGSRIQ